MDDQQKQRSLLARFPPVLQWVLLAALSLVIAVPLEYADFPAALLIGPMLAGILVAVGGGSIRLPAPFFFFVQIVLAMMIAGTVSPELVGTFAANWPLFLAVVLSVIAMSTLCGWLLGRTAILPGTTAIWGSSAGAASTMLVMADAYGADVRLVAFMQYLRVVMVASLATVVAHFAAPQTAAQDVPWFGPFEPAALALTLAVGIGGGFLGTMLRVPAGAFLMPFVLGAALNFSGHLTVELPQWLLALSFALLGWRIGLGFTRSILLHARRALFPTFASIVVLIGFCGTLALLLIVLLGVDPLTAYLATSPGGLDSVAVIAASSDVDLSFVMALQTSRLVIITLIGPAVARFVADRT
ncbi:AbrB family transcriptional regulator [Rhizobium sp. TRM95111]|uniref:AbrB family transcriptional regulator n=1 Tax=Rhizobium alarense TaxID=2846851 RepID=UPI001F31ABCD|nr:AbrB family transcriptional regulator [Rhizobium alarense]MCF3640554.1 AbrB family transcriptional regulator [Rhizobium alarense]